MSPGGLAALAVLVAIPALTAMYVAVHHHRGDLRWPRDAFAVLGLLLWAMVLAAVFVSPFPVARIIPPLAVLLGGAYLVRSGRRSHETTWEVAGWLLLAAGGMILLLGIGRSLLGTPAGRNRRAGLGQT